MQPSPFHREDRLDQRQKLQRTWGQHFVVPRVVSRAAGAVRARGGGGVVRGSFRRLRAIFADQLELRLLEAGAEKLLQRRDRALEPSREGCLLG